jgi:hypothetical protein
MMQFQIVSGYGYVGDGKVYEEHPKFGHYKAGCITYVCLVTGVNQSKYYALSNLRKVEAVRHTVADVDIAVIPEMEPVRADKPTGTPSALDEIATQLEADIHATAMGFIFEATKAQTKRMSERKMYALDLHARINSAITEPPRVTCTALTVWRPTIELPIWELGYFREGSKQKAIPGVNLLTSNVRIVLTLPEVKAA